MSASLSFWNVVFAAVVHTTFSGITILVRSEGGGGGKRGKVRHKLFVASCQSQEGMYLFFFFVL